MRMLLSNDMWFHRRGSEEALVGSVLLVKEMCLLYHDQEVLKGRNSKTRLPCSQESLSILKYRRAVDFIQGHLRAKTNAVLAEQWTEKHKRSPIGSNQRAMHPRTHQMPLQRLEAGHEGNSILLLLFSSIWYSVTHCLWIIATTTTTRRTVTIIRPFSCLLPEGLQVTYNTLKT